MHSFDSYGWLSSSPIAGRETDVEPPAHGDKIVGQPFPNWTGFEWVLVPYAEPVIPAPVIPSKRILTKKEMLLRITPAEYGAIRAAAAVDTNVDYFWQLYTLAEEVDKDDLVTITGFQTLEAAGILEPGRAAEILA